MNRSFALLWTGTLLTAAACSGSQAAQEEAKRATTVRIETLGRQNIAEVLRYVADLEPYAEVTIFSPVPDRILSFPWRDGDAIRRGQQIALIRKEGLDRGLEQIVAQAESLDIQLANLEQELGRSRELLKKGVLSQQMFDQVETRYKSTQAQRKALEAGRGQLAATAANAVITSPIDGIIANKRLETGDMAVPQIPLCSVVSIDRLKVKLKLIEADVTKVRNDQEVTVTLDAYPGRSFVGKVTNIHPYLDTLTRTNTVEVILDNPLDAELGSRPLKPGMYGSAELVVALHEGVLAAPEPALLLDNQVLAKQATGETLRKAFVIDDKNVARQRLVKLGARQGSQYEVLDGLSEGERVVIRGQHGLKDGQAVEIVSANN